MTAVMIGVDPHKGSHTAVVISPAEEPLGEIRVRASAAQAGKLAEWAAAWPERTWAVEGAAGLGRLLAQQLVAAGERVLDVQPKLASRVRLLQAGDTNKNDPNDALSVAIAALRSRTCPPGGRRGPPGGAESVVQASPGPGPAYVTRSPVPAARRAVRPGGPGGAARPISAAQATRLLDRSRRPVRWTGPRRARRCFPRGPAAHGCAAARHQQDAHHRGRGCRYQPCSVFGVGPVIAATVIGDIADVSRFPGRDHFASYNGTAPPRCPPGTARSTGCPCAATAAHQPRHPHGRDHPAQPQAQRRPRLLREEAGRGKNAQRGAQVPQAQDQRRHLRPPPRPTPARPQRPGPRAREGTRGTTLHPAPAGSHPARQLFDTLPDPAPAYDPPPLQPPRKRVLKKTQATT